MPPASTRTTQTTLQAMKPTGGRLPGVERVGRAHPGPRGEQDHGRRLEPVDHAAPQAVGRQQVAQRVGRPADRRRVERHGEVAQHAREPAEAEQHDRDRARGHPRQPRAEGERERQHGDRLEREEHDGDERLGRHVAAHQRDDRDRQQPREHRVDGDDDRQAEPAAHDELRPAERPREHRVDRARLDVRGDRRRGEERGRHREHEAEHERDEDQDLAHADLELDGLDPLARGRWTPAAASPTRRARRSRSPGTRAPRRPGAGRSRAGSGPRSPARAGRSRGGLRGRLGRADEVEEQVLEAAPAGVDGVDPAAGSDDRRDEVGDAVLVQARTTSQPSSSSSWSPKASMDDRSAGRPVTRMRTAAWPRSAVSGPAATTVPRLTIATRSQRRSTSPRRCELRRTAEPRACASRMMRPDVVATHGIEGGRGLVEDDERRVAEQGRTEAEALLHPLAEAAHPVVAAALEARRARALARPPSGGAPRRAPPAGRGARAPRAPSATPGSGTAPGGSRSGGAPRGRRAGGRGPSRSRRSGG